MREDALAPEMSLELIASLRLMRSAAILDLASGCSSLASTLVGMGYVDVTVADTSGDPLEFRQLGVERQASAVKRVHGDVLTHDFARQFDLWHDHASLVQLSTDDERTAYHRTLVRALKPGAHVVLAVPTGGPPLWPVLPSHAYHLGSIVEFLGPTFVLVTGRLHDHLQDGLTHQFLYVLARALETPRPQSL